jgi:hypothetical protein
MKNKKRIYEGYTLHCFLQDLDWKDGLDFKRVLMIPMLVSEPQPKNYGCNFTRVRISIEVLN